MGLEAAFARTRLAGLAVAVAALAVACVPEPDPEQTVTGLPSFEVDPSWPPPLPNDWVLGEVAGLAVDHRDHVWLVHRASALPPEDRDRGAPPVVELDVEGNVVGAWGGTDAGYDWPAREHGIFVDTDDHVWVGSEGDHLVLKFTRDGAPLLRIGEAGRTGGSDDPSLLGGPQDLYVDADAGELFVADGWDNRRVIVFDAETGEYLRHWGAYGEPPDDAEPGPYDPDQPPPRQFRTPVHGLTMSADGRIYVGDRTNNRIQVFDREGGFEREVFVAPRTSGPGSAFDVAFSHDTGQLFLYMADGANNRVWILRRADLELVGDFGGPGTDPGLFTSVHNVEVDSRGNLYTTEVRVTNRVQKFWFRGWEAER